MPSRTSLILTLVVALSATLVVANPATGTWTDWSLDRSFGDGEGFISDDLNGDYSRANDLAIDSSGRIVVGAYGCDDDDDYDLFCVVRYTPDGERDLTFGDGDGIVTTQPGREDRYADTESIAIDSVGRIIVTGQCEPDEGSHHHYCTVRYTSDGELDTTFGGDGIVTTQPDEEDEYSYAQSVAIDSADRIIVTGYCDAGEGGYDHYCTVRYTSDGELDTTFGGDGIVTTQPGEEDQYSYANDVTVDSADRIIVTGYCDPYEDDTDDVFCTVRYTSDGELDTTFGGDGIVTTGFGGGYSSADTVLTDTAGRVLVSGECDPPGFDDGVCLARYTDDGELDPTFGDGGIVKQGPVEDNGWWDHNHDGISAIDSSGRIMTVSECDDDNEHLLCAWRFLPDGTLDTTWGGGDGAIKWGPGPRERMQHFEPEAIAFDAADRPIIAGDCERQGSDDIVCVVVLQTAPIGIDCSTSRATPFDDIDASSYAYDAVGCLYALGITQGTSATSYGPDGLVTREQMAAFLARFHTDALGIECSGEHPFTDIDASSYAYDAVGCLYALGITQGTSATSYEPDGLVTREQMAAFLARMYRALLVEDCASVSFFVDVPSSSFAKLDVGCLVDIGVTTGTSFETYSPYEYVTREQMAAFLSRLYTALF